MEARKFFENSPMHEITVSAEPGMWRDVLLDLEEMRAQIHYYRSLRVVDDDGTYEYEVGTSYLIEQLEAIL